MSTPTPRAPNRLPGEVRILSAEMALNGDLTITWSAEAGRRYRLFSKDNLSATEWTDLGEVIPSGALGASTIPFNGSPQRFFRIQRQ
jgi:hypothetical protein